MSFTGKIAIIGGGSWATALAKIVLSTQDQIVWYMRRPDRIEDFVRMKHNPAYLSGVTFDVSRIQFCSDLNEAVKLADILVLATPSPFLKQHLDTLNTPLNNKFILSAIKGIVPDENMLVTDYFLKKYAVLPTEIAVISGASHAEEIALERLSFLTVAGKNQAKAEAIANIFNNAYVRTSCSTDVAGIEYASVLKNVYAIVAGIYHGMKYGDNFQAVYVSNAINEMKRFVDTASPLERDISASVYLGDLLVTTYSRYSRNRIFGTMIGKGYTVKTAQLEMEMIAEGFYATKCIYEINQQLKADIPIVDALHAILYQKASPIAVMKQLTKTFK